MLCQADAPAVASTEATQRGGLELVAGGLCGLVEALDAVHAAGETAVLAVVVATEGSTYQKPGALVLLDRGGVRHGVISGGCLEPEIEALAAEVLSSGRARLIDFDTRSDEDLTFGSGTGCRGRVRLVLLPQPPHAPFAQALAALAKGGRALAVTLSLADGSGWAHPAASDGRSAPQPWRWGADGATASAPADAVADGNCARIVVAAPRSLLLLGAGPETPVLLAFLRPLGWMVRVVEHRQRWRRFVLGAPTENIVELAPQAAAAYWRREHVDAILLMSHNYHLDLQALRLCAQSDVGYVGLLGPASRRDALLADLGDADASRLRPRLHAPVGLPLGGSGPVSIAIAIAAELQQHFSAAQYPKQEAKIAADGALSSAA